MFYRVGDGEFSSKTVGADVYETRINIVNVPEPYEIRVAGFTKGGVGPMSWPRQVRGTSLNDRKERLPEPAPELTGWIG